MKEQDRNRVYRARIQAETKKIRAEDVFSSPSYLELLRSIARELTDGRFDDISLYCRPGDGCMGRCDGRKIMINLGNGVTGSFQELPQKNMSLVGILGHECGHKNYSDFGLRKKYVDGFLKGIWYPHPPCAETVQEKQDLEQMKGYFERKDQDALALIVQVAAYLHNLLEDIYTENKMCARFPGSIRNGILLNRGRNVEWIPTLRELMEENEDDVSILMNLCGQYALSGRINNWDNGESELLDTVKVLMPVIRKACADESSSARFMAVNRIILKIWKYLYRIIREIEKKKEENEEQKEDQKKNQDGNDGKDNKTGENREKNDGNGQENKEATPDMQEYLDHLTRRIPQFIKDPPEEKGFRGFPKDEEWSGSWQKAEPEKGKLFIQSVSDRNQGDDTEDDNPEGKVDVKIDTGKEAQTEKIMIKLVDADGPVQEILHQFAKKCVDEQMNREINLQLQKLMDEIEFEAGHAKVKKIVCRECAITLQQKEQYKKYAEQVNKVQRRLNSALIPILQNQGARTERRLFLGKRIDMRSISNPQGAIYRKDYPGKKVDMALAILIDMSGSMCNARMEQSKLAALCLYDFCRKAGIAVSVYGHHTDGYRHKCLEDETVFLHCCAEFEPDENDRYRMAALRPAGANRDGVALRFMGKKLMNRPEKQKLLVVISDGLPNSNRYNGKMAQEDLTSVKKELIRNGVVFLAAAIGADKERIREIYQEAFLDISDIEKLPAVLTKQVIKYIRRY